MRHRRRVVVTIPFVGVWMSRLRAVAVLALLSGALLWLGVAAFADEPTGGSTTIVQSNVPPEAEWLTAIKALSTVSPAGAFAFVAWLASRFKLPPIVVLLDVGRDDDGHRRPIPFVQVPATRTRTADPP